MLLSVRAAVNDSGSPRRLEGAGSTVAMTTVMPHNGTIINTLTRARFTVLRGLAGRLKQEHAMSGVAIRVERPLDGYPLERRDDTPLSGDVFIGGLPVVRCDLLGHWSVGRFLRSKAEGWSS